MTEKEARISGKENLSFKICDFDPKQLIAVFPDWTWEEKVFVQFFSGSKKIPQKDERGWLFRTDMGLIQLTKEPASALIMAKKSEFRVKDLERICINKNRNFSTIIFEGRRRQLIYERFNNSNNGRIHINNIGENGKIEYSDIISL